VENFLHKQLAMCLKLRHAEFHDLMQGEHF